MDFNVGEVMPWQAGRLWFWMLLLAKDFSLKTTVHEYIILVVQLVDYTNLNTITYSTIVSCVRVFRTLNLNKYLKNSYLKPMFISQYLASKEIMVGRSVLLMRLALIPPAWVRVQIFSLKNSSCVAIFCWPNKKRHEEKGLWGRSDIFCRFKPSPPGVISLKLVLINYPWRG